MGSPDVSRPLGRGQEQWPRAPHLPDCTADPVRSARTAAALGNQGRGGQEARALRRLQATARALLATRSDMIGGS